jgi:sugar/nucleoside kinase (ribokinase family)
VAAVSAGVAHIPAPIVEAVDTTGAGDAHSGVFLASLADRLSPADAARRANAAAALAVTRPGPATGPTRAELDAWLAEIDV